MIDWRCQLIAVRRGTVANFADLARSISDCAARHSNASRYNPSIKNMCETRVIWRNSVIFFKDIFGSLNEIILNICEDLTIMNNDRYCIVDIVKKNLAKDVVSSCTCNIMSGDNWIYFKFFGQIPCHLYHPTVRARGSLSMTHYLLQARALTKSTVVHCT